MAKLSKSVPLAVGALAVCALALTSASAASLADGKFLIRAQNDAEPTIEAVAGSRGTTSGNPGGPGTENPSDFTPVSYSCGPMTFTVTADMYEFSKKNQELRAEGRESEIVNDPSGWNTIYTYNGALTEGFPSDGTKPMIAYLGVEASLDTSKMAAVVSNMGGGQCSVADYRNPRAGDRAAYQVGGGYISDTRFLSTGGKIVTAQAQLADSGDVTFTVFNSIADSGPFLTSETQPYWIWAVADGSKVVKILLPEAIDGYNEIVVNENPGGNGYALYNMRSDENTVAQAVRNEGPVAVYWNAAGEFTSFSYSDSSGMIQTIGDRGTPYTLAEYNSIAEQDWDGSYHIVSDFNSDLPFTPTPLS